jgi:hypothetical protein
MNNGATEARDRCTRFAHYNWVSLAGAAYRHFKKQGRGALLVDWKSLEAWERNEAFTLGVPYVTYHEEPEIQTLIESYNPAKQIVLFVTTDSEAVASAPDGGPGIIKAGERVSVWIIDPPFPENVPYTLVSAAAS